MSGVKVCISHCLKIEIPCNILSFSHFSIQENASTVVRLVEGTEEQKNGRNLVEGQSCLFLFVLKRCAEI